MSTYIYMGIGGDNAVSPEARKEFDEREQKIREAHRERLAQIQARKLKESEKSEKSEKGEKGEKVETEGYSTKDKFQPTPPERSKEENEALLQLLIESRRRFR